MQTFTSSQHCTLSTSTWRSKNKQEKDKHCKCIHQHSSINVREDTQHATPVTIKSQILTHICVCWCQLSVCAQSTAQFCPVFLAVMKVHKTSAFPCCSSPSHPAENNGRTFLSHITTDYSWTLGEWQTFRNKNHDKMVCAKRGGLWKGWVGVINPFNAENFILLVLHISSQQSQRHTWLTPDTCPFSALCSTWELTHELWH